MLSAIELSQTGQGKGDKDNVVAAGIASCPNTHSTVNGSRSGSSPMHAAMTAG